MIVRRADGTLHLVTQPDHAALSGRIMARWPALDAEPRRASILRAIEQHDNGWIEPDAEPSIDPETGAVQDFMSAPTAVRQGVWPRGVARLAGDPWAAALVAQHAITVYDRYRGDPEWTRFFADMSALRDRMLEPAGGDPSLRMSGLLHDYVYLRVGDLISLMFCNGWTETLAYRDWTFRLDGARVVVAPDGFGGREVPFTVTAVEIADRVFASAADLRAAFGAGRRVTLAGSASGG